jgi:hypothetical protein
MSRFRIEHPKKPDLYAIGGVDPTLGFFCEIFKEGRERPLESLDFFKKGTAVTLQDCFDLLSRNGFFRLDQLQEVLVHLQDGTPIPKRLLKIAKIVEEFKHAAD